MFSMPAWVNPAPPPQRPTAPGGPGKADATKRPESEFSDVLARQFEPQGQEAGAAPDEASEARPQASSEASQEGQPNDPAETAEGEQVGSQEPAAPIELSDELAAEMKLRADAMPAPEPKRSATPAPVPLAETESEATAQTSSDPARGTQWTLPASTQAAPVADGSTPGKAASLSQQPAPDSGKADSTAVRSFDAVLAHATRKTDAPPSAPPAPPPTPDQANADRVANAITTKLLPGGGKMEIRLDPPQLGRVHIDVQVVSGKLTATFTASNDEASRMLGHKLDHLRQSLETSGLTVDRLQVRTSSESSMRDASADQQQQSTGHDQRQGQSQDQRDLARRLWKKAMFGTDGLDVVG